MKSYAKSTIVALGGGLLLVIAYRLLSGEGNAISTHFIDMMYAAALLLPLAAFAGGLSTGGESTGKHRAWIYGAAIGLVALLLAAVVAPVLARLLDQVMSLSPNPDSHATLFGWMEEYGRLSADRDAGRPVLAWMVAVAGVQAVQPFAIALAAIVISMCGSAIGNATRRLGDRRSAALCNWVAGLIVIASTAVAYDFAMTIAISNGVSAWLSFAMVPAPALLLLGGLMGGRFLQIDARAVGAEVPGEA